MPDEFSCISIDEYIFLISIGNIYIGYVMDNDGMLMFSACNILMSLPEFWDINNPPLQAPQGEDMVETVSVCTLLVPDKKPVMPSTNEIMNKVYRINADRSQTINFPDGRTVNLPPEPDGHVYIHLSDTTFINHTRYPQTMHIAIQTNNYQTGKTQVYDNQMTIGQLQQYYNIPIQYESYDYWAFINNIVGALSNGYSTWENIFYKPNAYNYIPKKGDMAGKFTEIWKRNKAGEYIYKDGMRIPKSENAASKLRLTRNISKIGKSLGIIGVFITIVTMNETKKATGRYNPNEVLDVIVGIGTIIFPPAWVVSVPYFISRLFGFGFW